MKTHKFSCSLLSRAAGTADAATISVEESGGVVVSGSTDTRTKAYNVGWTGDGKVETVVKW